MISLWDLRTSGRCVVYPAYPVTANDLASQFILEAEKLVADQSFSRAKANAHALIVEKETGLCVEFKAANGNPVVNLHVTPTMVSADYRVVTHDALGPISIVSGILFALIAPAPMSYLGWGLPFFYGTDYVAKRMYWNLKIEELLKASVKALPPA
ncbi:MAG: hypothetical protein AAF170_05015 [Bacteroidota bacterium]